MPIYYCDGIAGNDVWSGLAPVWNGVDGPKATLNGCEDVPITAGSLVHVRPTNYRELLTVDVNGVAGQVIEYRGDYAGLIWANPTGIVPRITGSNNDIAAFRASCISATTKSYRTFTNFILDTVTLRVIELLTGCTNITIDKCYALNAPLGSNLIYTDDANQSTIIISNCLLDGSSTGAYGIYFTHTVTVSNAGHIIQNCVLRGGGNGYSIGSVRVGGITVKNCYLTRGNGGIRVVTALAVGQTITVNNCIFESVAYALYATALGQIMEDFNNFWNVSAPRTNVAVGANSLAYPTMPDARWFFQVVNAGAGPNSPTQVVSPFDLASYSQLINVAGLAPTATDMRGTGTIGAQREWGTLEYDTTLKLAGGGGIGSRIAHGLVV